MQPNVHAFPIRGVVPVYRCAAGCDAVVASDGAICLGCAADATDLLNAVFGPLPHARPGVL
jgi:hypothetical protein